MSKRNPRIRTATRGSTVDAYIVPSEGGGGVGGGGAANIGGDIFKVLVRAALRLVGASTR